MVMKKKLLSYLSFGTLITGAGIGIYALADTYFLKTRIPVGSCPVTNNKSLIYTAIILCGISFVLSFFESKAEKTQ